ncbi:MAG TPA: SpoIIE family protein phosphatase [Acidimicrobiia bacterium]|nr:SpoIIE family protein phosphatase [Acidimicrobiia bacterium]
MRWLEARSRHEQLAIVALTYYLAGELGLRLSLVGHSVTPLWPPTGVAVVALLALGRRAWPAITLAALAINLPIGPTVPAAALIAVGNTLAPLVAVALLERANFRINLGRVRDVAALVFLAAFTAMSVSATIGTAALYGAGEVTRHNLAGAWSVWWTGDAMGVLIVAPFLWSFWGTPARTGRRRMLEIVGCSGVLLGTCAMAFVPSTPVLFIVVPVVAFVSWRFGQRGAARADLVVSVIATIVAAHEVGPFADLSLLARMVTLQSFNATVVFTSLLLAAAVSQRADLAAAQREAVETLQRSLLPDRLPDVPGLELAARYIPASQHVELGGDWYDVIALENGRYGLVIGDVAGHGILAAAVMGKLRMTLRAYAFDGSSCGSVLERVNSLLRDVQEGATATVWYGRYDPRDRTLEYANAGHVPPLLAGADGAEPTFLDDVHGPPLGAVSGVSFSHSRRRLDDGATLLLYTDGLIERRNTSIDDGLASLRAQAHRNGTDLQTACDDVIHALVADAAEDDIAMLAVRLQGTGEEQHIRRPAVPASVPQVRHMLQVWLADRGIGGDDAFEILVATTEACANVVTHAYGLKAGAMDVTAHLSEQRVHVVVADDGGWRTAATNDGGHGLTIMRSVMDHVEIVTTPKTEVRMARRLLESTNE